MNLNEFSHLLRQYEIVAIDDYNQVPNGVYITKQGFQANELTMVIKIDFDGKVVYAPQMIGSYAKFMTPIRMINPLQDDIKGILKKIDRLPELAKINLLKLMQAKEIHDEEYLIFSDQEKYLFNVINKRYHENGFLEVFDFFYIIIWKANRAKSTMAKMLLKRFKNLDIASKDITSYLHNENLSDYERFKFLLDIGFHLPMLSAILTVLYPDRFSVYDFRVCEEEELKQFSSLSVTKADTKKYWEMYQEFLKTLIYVTPSWMTLRQKDQYLWGKSFANQLKKDIEVNFRIITP